MSTWALSIQCESADSLMGAVYAAVVASASEALCHDLTKSSQLMM